MYRDNCHLSADDKKWSTLMRFYLLILKLKIEKISDTFTIMDTDAITKGKQIGKGIVQPIKKVK